MRRTSPVSARQRAVLQWVADGCPDGVYTDHMQYRLSAAALRNRGLVTLHRHNRVWGATITDAGRSFLDHGRVPEPVQATEPEPAAEPAARPAVPVPGSVAELVGLLADGPLLVPDPDGETRAQWRKLAYGAWRSDAIPADHYVNLHGRDRGDLTVALLPGSAPRSEIEGRLPDIPVLRGELVLHPALASMGYDASRILGVSIFSTARALRLLHTLFVAAQEYGCTVVRQEAAGEAQFTVLRDGVAIDLGMSEEFKSKDELIASNASAWEVMRGRGARVRSGRLVLDLGKDSRFHRRPHRWADRQRWRLDGKLSLVLTEVLWRMTDLDGPRQP